MADKYQGWTNRETFGLASILDNDRDLQQYWTDRAQFCREDCNTKDGMVETLAEMLEQDHDEQIEAIRGSLPMFVSQLLTDAMSQVNWGEIAEHLLAQ